MSAEFAIYLDSSAIVKLALREPETDALRSHLRRAHRRTTSSALARTEVVRAVIGDEQDRRRAQEVLAGIDLVSVSNRILQAAGTVQPSDVRSLDAIHLATAMEIRAMLHHLITYDVRMADAATTHGIRVVMPI